MNLKAEIELIKQQLNDVDDEKLLNIIRQMLTYGKTKREGAQPLTREEFYARQEESTKAIADQTLISQEEAVEYFKRKKERE